MKNVAIDGRYKGFTLVELMIVVVIISILAAIAIPAYQSSIQKSRRSDAKIALERAASMQEQFYFTHNAYTETMSNIGGSDSPEGYYTLSSSTASADTACSADNICYKLTATATGTQLDDTNCRKLTLTNTGTKASLDSGGADSSDCW